MKKTITNTFISLLICMLLGTSLGEVQGSYSTRIQKSDSITETEDDQSLATAVSISVGGDHTCAVTAEGGVRCWGVNYYGQLGNDNVTIVDSPTPVDVQGFTDKVVIAVSAGFAHTCAVTSAGDVWCWGNNYYGQLGNDTKVDSPTPVIVDGFTEKVIAISAGHFYTCALTSDGGIKCWGDNSVGQLGYITTTTCDYGPCSSIPMNVVGFDNEGEDAIAISAGAYHTCALTSGGGVKCWGNNFYGQLGDGETTNSSIPVDVNRLNSGVKAISAGGSHNCAVTSEGGVKCWGYNSDGQLGDGTKDDSPIPVDVSGLTSGVKAISAGGSHNCALTNPGVVKCWGNNEYGKLGDTSTTDRHTPVLVGELSIGVKAISAGDYHTCALSLGGAVKCWGKNDYGQLGDGTTTRLTPPVDVFELTNGVDEISANYQYTCALTDTGGVKYWGDRLFGSNDPDDNFVNTNSSIPIDVEGLTSGVKSISTGKYHTCAITSTDGVKCWGYNYLGQLGDGTTDDSLTPVDVVGLTGEVVIDISAGDDHTCALTDEGEVKCWGSDIFSQLGDETDNTYSNIPVDVYGFDDIGEVAIAISAGGHHTCVITSEDGIKCWGNNSDGQLGDKTTAERNTPVVVYGFEDEGENAREIIAGSEHTCAITDTNGVKCWGLNRNGQLGNNDDKSSSIPITVYGFTDDGEDGATISAGNRHTCVITSSGAIKCWGDNWDGQLGNGTNGYESKIPVDVVGLSSGVKAVSAGTQHTCAITDTDGVKCWGDNTRGQLGWRLLWVPVDVIGFVEKFMVYLPMIDR
ncbi:MAG: hypothetical protein Q7U53_13490 [Anaerolineaceae bacterium]|nr:hypothetical protein [Anaerolineaceae bacterium]